MPPVRRRANFHQLTPFERGRIVGLREAGLSFRDIANRVGRSVATIALCWRRWRENNEERRRPRPGRPRRTTGREDRALRLAALRDRFSSTREIGDRWRDLLHQQISIRTVYRRIRSFGLRSYRPFLCLPLTPRHRTARLEWANDRLHWNEEWNRVVFSDESRFCLWCHDGRRMVRRRPGERRNLQFFQQRHTALTRGVMVWGAICHGSRSPLVIIPGTLDANRFINHVLRPVLIPYLQELVNPIFQQDNARPHTARVTIEFMNNANIDLLPWPSRSPDLSPIEHVWDMVGRRVNNLQPPPNSIEILQQRILEVWDSIPQATIDALISSMPNRVAECVRSRGWPTHY